MTEGYAPGLTTEQFVGAVTRAHEVASRMRREGVAVRCLHLILIPEEETCLCLFEGPSHEAVIALTRLAELPCHRVVEVLELSVDPAGG